MLKVKKTGLLALSIGLALMVLQVGYSRFLDMEKSAAAYSDAGARAVPQQALNAQKQEDLSYKNKFSDLKTDDWYTQDILRLTKMGFISGYEDGTFKPGKKIAAGEFLKLLLTSVGEKVQIQPDTPWYDSYAKRAEELGIIEKRETYNYEAVINRSTMAKMVYKLLKLTPEKPEGVILADVDSIDMKWVDTVFNECLMRGFMTDSGQLVFRPNQAATRGEACAVIARILDFMRDPEGYRKAKVSHQEGSDRSSYLVQKEEAPVTQEIPVLLYHHLLKKEENKNFRNNFSVVDVEEFERQIQMLYEKGFYTITPFELEKFLNKEINLPFKSVLITFDDGYLSNYVYAYPILKKYGFRATVFVVTSGIHSTPQKFNPDLLNFLSWDEINKSLDVFDFASHSHAMHNQDKGQSYLVTKPENDIRQDIKRSKELLGLDYFAYPYGQYNAKTIAILKEQGFKLAFTTKEGNVTRNSNPFELGRYYMNPGRDIAGVLKKAYPDYDK